MSQTNNKIQDEKLIFYPQFIMKWVCYEEQHSTSSVGSVGIVKHNVTQYDVVVFQRFNSTPGEQFIVGNIINTIFWQLSR